MKTRWYNNSLQSGETEAKLMFDTADDGNTFYEQQSDKSPLQSGAWPVSVGQYYQPIFSGERYVSIDIYVIITS